MAAGVQTQAVQTITSQLMPAATPTALSSAVAQIIAGTPQSPIPVIAGYRLPVGQQPLPPPPSRMPYYLGGAAGVVGLGVLAWILLRKKKR